jgi:hypothetical protein
MRGGMEWRYLDNCRGGKRNIFEVVIDVLLKIQLFWDVHLVSW